MELFYFEGLPYAAGVMPVKMVPKGHGSIYVVLNTINGKLYVGQSRRNALSRWKGHINSAKNGSPLYFHQAIRKYNKENFSLGILDFSASPEELDRQERYWILHLHTTDKRFGYNLASGGFSGKHGEATCEKLSEIKKKEWNDPVLREKRTQSLAKARSCPEFKQKQRQLSQERWRKPDFRNKMLEAMSTPSAVKNRTQSALLAWENPERKQHMSQVMREKWKDPEYRLETNEKREASMSSPVYRKQRREGTSELWKNPEFREKIAASKKKPEAAKKRSESSKAKWKNPVYAEKMSRIHRQQWADPKFREEQMRKREQTKAKKAERKNIDKIEGNVVS